tara:strand:+ start:5441 stop:6691 length:1251 start_codon:yes stop_codon:yes gene_type:complete
MANELIDYNFNPRYSASLRNRPSGSIGDQGSFEISSPAGYMIPRNLPELRVQPSGILPSLANLGINDRQPSANIGIPEIPNFEAATAYKPEPASEPQGLGQRAKGILGSIGSFLSNPNTLDNLAIGFGGMSLNPNQGLMQQAANRIDNRQALQIAQNNKNRTIQTLRNMGMDREASILENADPTMVATLAAEYLSPDYINTGGQRPVGIPMEDPVTGQVFFVTSNGERLDIEGAYQETPNQEFLREVGQAQIDLAKDKGLEAFNGILAVDQQMVIYDSMLELLADPTSDTGVIRNYLPAFDQATAQLRSLANRLGLEIIAGTTFGALSAGELRLALDTAIDMSQSKENVAGQIRRKQALQQQIRAVLEEQALILTSGTIGYDQYIEDYINQTREDQASTPAEEGNDPLGLFPQAGQ